MPSIFQKILDSLRLSNLVGNSMPDRIRSIGFAFLGLTAAAGLAMVALFAQMGFPLLPPRPLPSGPAEQSSVAKAVQLGQGPARIGLAQAQGAAEVAAAPSAQGASKATAGDRRAGTVDSSAVAVAGAPEADSPVVSEPAATTPPAPSPAPAPVPTPAPPSEPDPALAEAPVSIPGTGTKPGKSSAGSNPEVEEEPAEAKPAKPPSKPSDPQPAKPPKGKPESKTDEPEATPPPAPSYVPAPAPAPVDKDKGKRRVEKGEKTDG